MNQDFASFLRARRLERGLSQKELAQRVHVSERTLRYWETGTTSPGQWELESLLTILELTAREHAQALALLPTRRGIRLFRAASHSALLPAKERGPLPVLGDLLQAMRLRRGLTQSQLALSLQISRSTILRWETADARPSEENLARMCTLLGAYPEEKLALSDRRIPLWEGKPYLSLEECAEQVEILDKQGGKLQTPLIDLQALALKRQLWLLAGENAAALGLLARVQIIHATWLMLYERRREAEICIQRSLDILRGHKAMELFWQAAVNLAAQFASEGRGGAIAGVQMLKRWLPFFPKEMQATLWCDMALHAGRAQQHEAAAAYLKNVRDMLPHSANEQGMVEHYYPLTAARTLLSAGQPHKALEWLPLPDGIEQVTSRAFYQLLWIEAFLDAGEVDTAQRRMDQLNVLIAQYPQPRLARTLDVLSTRL